MAVRVLIADDQDLVRSGLRMIVAAADDLEVVGEARDGAAAVRQALELRPNVVLMDIRMPGMDGIEATRMLAGRDVDDPVAVLVLTTFDLDEYVFAALRAGASGFLLKDTDPPALLNAIRMVADGQGLIDPSVTRRVIEEFAEQPTSPSAPPAELDTLTPREREVFDLVVRGASNAEIARRLYVEPATVKTHVAHAFDKLGLRDRVEAVIYAYEQGVLTPGAG